MNLLAYLNRHIPKDILYIFILAVGLTITRITLFNSLYLLYMLWNIFLAILPFIVSLVLVYISNKNKLSTWLFALGGIVWVLLLPNAPYMVTDLIHIGRGHDRVPMLFDSFLLFSCAWLGMLLFMHSLFHVEKIILEKYGKLITRIKIPSIILLVSVGIYIGRYLRFNSWDVFSDPTFFGDTWQGIVHPSHISEAAMFISTCFVFLYLSYLAWKPKVQN